MRRTSATGLREVDGVEQFDLPPGVSQLATRRVEVGPSGVEVADHSVQDALVAARSLQLHHAVPQSRLLGGAGRDRRLQGLGPLDQVALEGAQGGEARL